MQSTYSNSLLLKKDFYSFPEFWIQNFKLIKNYNFLYNNQLVLSSTFLFFFSILNAQKFKQVLNQNEPKLLFFPSKILKTKFSKSTKNNIFVAVLSTITDLFFFYPMLTTNVVCLLNIFLKDTLVKVPNFFIKIIKLKKNYFLITKYVSVIKIRSLEESFRLKIKFLNFLNQITSILLYQV